MHVYMLVCVRACVLGVVRSFRLWSYGTRNFKKCGQRRQNWMGLWSRYIYIYIYIYISLFCILVNDDVSLYFIEYNFLYSYPCTPDMYVYSPSMRICKPF